MIEYFIGGKPLGNTPAFTLDGGAGVFFILFGAFLSLYERPQLDLYYVPYSIRQE